MANKDLAEGVSAAEAGMFVVSMVRVAIQCDTCVTVKHVLYCKIRAYPDDSPRPALAIVPRET